MTARDEAIQAMASVLHIDPVISQWASHIGRAIDAIPPGVLARLAIEQGALEQVAWRFETVRPRSDDRPRYGFMSYLSGEAGHADHERVYRVVEP